MELVTGYIVDLFKGNIEKVERRNGGGIATYYLGETQ